MLPVFFLIAGIVADAVGAWLLVKTRTFVSRARPAEGRYVGAQTDLTPMRDAATQYGLIEFATPDGRAVQFESRLGAFGQDQKRGQGVSVLYDPNDPKEAVINSFLELWMPAVIFLAVGAGLTIAALVVMVVM